MIAFAQNCICEEKRRTNELLLKSIDKKARPFLTRKWCFPAFPKIVSHTA